MTSKASEDNHAVEELLRLSGLDMLQPKPTPTIPEAPKRAQRPKVLPARLKDLELLDEGGVVHGSRSDEPKAKKAKKEPRHASSQQEVKEAAAASVTASVTVTDDVTEVEPPLEEDLKHGDFAGLFFKCCSTSFINFRQRPEVGTPRGCGWSALGGRLQHLGAVATERASGAPLYCSWSEGPLQKIWIFCAHE